MAKETILYGEVKFRERSISQDLTARLIGVDSNGNLVDRPAIDTTTFITTSLASGRVWIGSAGGAATAVDTASVGDILASSVGGLTIKAGTIVDADISGSAAIAKTKLALAGTIVNADINAAAAIAYSKLNLALGIVNADISATAAIVRTKIASGTAYRLVANDGTGVMSENAAITASRAVASDANGQLVASATTATQLGYSSTLTGDIQTQLDNEVATKTVKAIVKAPTVAEHGYAITWDNAAGQWDLTDPVTQGIPVGGNTGQVLAKVDGSDWNVAWVDVSTTLSAPGIDTQVIFNDGGVAGTDVNFVFDKALDALSIAGVRIKGGGAGNTFVGASSGLPGASGINNTAFGSNTLIALTSGSANTVIGMQAGLDLTTATGTVLIGYTAGSNITSGDYNVAIGYQALLTATTGSENIAIGRLAGTDLTVGNFNIMIGLNAGGNIIGGADNVLIGRQAGDGITSGSDNVFLGLSMARNVTTGIKNVAIGYAIDLPSATANGQLSIQNAIFGTGNIEGGTNISTGNIGLYVAAPSARLHLPAGTATAGTAPLKLTTGTALGTPENGAIEYHNTRLYFTRNSERHEIQTLLTVEYQILNAELQTIFATPKVLIPAPGSGKQIIVHSIYVQQKTNTTDYPTNAEGGTWTIVVVGAAATTTINSPSTLRIGASFPDHWTYYTRITTFSNNFTDNYENGRVELRTSTLVTGAGDTQMNIKLVYEIVNLGF